MSDYISAESQRLVIEKLYRSDDSVTSTEKFNKEHSSTTGRMGYSSMTLYDFGKKMKKTSFLSYDVERFIKSVTGKTIDLETL